MDITTLLNDNALNLIIIFVLAFIGFVYRKRTKKQYVDNIIKYADILEKHHSQNIKKIISIILRRSYFGKRFVFINQVTSIKKELRYR